MLADVMTASETREDRAIATQAARSARKPPENGTACWPGTRGRKRGANCTSTTAGGRSVRSANACTRKQ